MSIVARVRCDAFTLAFIKTYISISSISIHTFSLDS